MLSQKEPILAVFRGHRAPELSDLSSDLRSGSRAALIASEKFGPRDVASRFLVSILKPAPAAAAAAAACRGVIDLKYGL